MEIVDTDYKLFLLPSLPSLFPLCCRDKILISQLSSLLVQPSLSHHTVDRKARHSKGALP